MRGECVLDPQHMFQRLVRHGTLGRSVWSHPSSEGGAVRSSSDNGIVHRILLRIEFVEFDISFTRRRYNARGSHRRSEARLYRTRQCTPSSGPECSTTNAACSQVAKAARLNKRWLMGNSRTFRKPVWCRSMKYMLAGHLVWINPKSGPSPCPVIRRLRRSHIRIISALYDAKYTELFSSTGIAIAGPLMLGGEDPARPISPSVAILWTLRCK